METKIALVTGGTSGVGLSIVRELTQHNYTVFFIGRNLEKGKSIETELNQKSSNHHFIPLDLSDLDAVTIFVKKIKTEFKKLDLLVNVAGIINTKQLLTNKGLDKTFSVGYLSVFILCNGLIPILEKGENARIVNVSGEPFQVLKPILDFKNLNFKNKNGFKIAFDTMHAKTVLTQILSEKLKTKNITVNSFHPGIVQSNLGRDLPILFRILSKMALLFMSKKSSNGIYCCLSDTINDKSGYLFVKKKPIKISFTKEYQELLWNKTVLIINA